MLVGDYPRHQGKSPEQPGLKVSGFFSLMDWTCSPTVTVNSRVCLWRYTVSVTVSLILHRAMAVVSSVWLAISFSLTGLLIGRFFHILCRPVLSKRCIGGCCRERLGGIFVNIVHKRTPIFSVCQNRITPAFSGTKEAEVIYKFFITVFRAALGWFFIMSQNSSPMEGQLWQNE